ncbi:MAG TPA: TIGR02677 family protein [Pirellulales bacterium]|nr:TIGR02677 family protein [Pirellulales bacterium]
MAINREKGMGATDDNRGHGGPSTLGDDAFIGFRYLIADRSDLYRSVIDVFTEAKAEFRLHLRTAEIYTSLLDRGQRASEEETVAVLDQLVNWGNLQSYHDTSEVATLADFHRRKLLYQLTAAGEAAQRAAVEFLNWLSRPIALEAEALERIHDLLDELSQMLDSADRDSGKLTMVLRQIATDAEGLTAQAQGFFRWLHEQTFLRGADLESFLRYKEKLIDYLQRFLAELALQTGRIAARIDALEPRALEFLQIAAQQEAAVAFARDDAERQSLVVASRARQEQRWRGLRRWFVGIDGDPQVKQLRAAAGAAIPRVLVIAGQLHERRASRSDRRADMLELAAWFLEAGDDREAHRLWSSAFATGSVRHLHVNPATIDERDQQPVPADRSWLDAPPIWIAPQLRRTGRSPAAAPARRIVDRAAGRRELRRRQDDELQRLARAQRSLINLGPRRLAEIQYLESDAMHLLLELLDSAAGCRLRGSQGTALSDDGSLRIMVDWNTPQQIATIETCTGYLHSRDAHIHIVATDDG